MKDAFFVENVIDLSLFVNLSRTRMHRILSQAAYSEMFGREGVWTEPEVQGAQSDPSLRNNEVPAIAVSAWENFVIAL